MGFTMEMNWTIVTNKQAERENERFFHLVEEGYNMYPLHHPVPIRKFAEKHPFGEAVIHKVAWEDGQTMIRYELVKLSSVN